VNTVRLDSGFRRNDDYAPGASPKKLQNNALFGKTHYFATLGRLFWHYFFLLLLRFSPHNRQKHRIYRFFYRFFLIFTKTRGFFAYGTEVALITCGVGGENAHYTFLLTVFINKLI